FTLAGHFHVTDLTEETAQLSLQGAQSRAIIERVLGQEAAQVERMRGRVVRWHGQPLTIMCATHTSEDGFDLIGGASLIAELRPALVAAGALACGAKALEVLRVEAGVARYGVDMTETNVVLESVPDDAVSFTKGCYVGEEVVAGVHWRGHVAAKFAGAVFYDEWGGA